MHSTCAFMHRYRYRLSVQVLENINKTVQEFSIRNKIDQIIAQIDIEQSNSMIEAFFRSLKNNYLYFTELRTFESIEKKVEFYVNEHNNSIPHPGIKYCIPAEIYNGKNISFSSIL